jgi:hypothetical protein
VVASRQFPVRDSGIRHQEAALGCGGVRGQGRVLWAARPTRGKEIGQGARSGFCTKAERKNGGRVRAHPHDRGRRRGWVRSCHVEEDIMGGGGWQPMACGRAAPTASRQRWVQVSVTAHGSRGAGWRVLAARVGVGRSGKGGSLAGPRATMPIFYLNEFPN